MKNLTLGYITLLAMGIVACLLVLLSTFNTVVSILAIIILIAELYLITRNIKAYTKRIVPKVYRFYHLYLNTDITNNETVVLGELGKKNVIRLRKAFSNSPLYKIFNKDSVLVYNINERSLQSGHRCTQVIGYVLATDQYEAYTILRHYQFSNPDNKVYHNLVNKITA